MEIIARALARRRHRRYLSDSRAKLLETMRQLEDRRITELAELPADDEEERTAASTSIDYHYDSQIEPFRKQMRAFDEMELRDELERWWIDAPEPGPDFLRAGRRALRDGRRQSIEWWVKTVFSPTISVIALVVAIFAAMSKSCGAAAHPGALGMAPSESSVPAVPSPSTSAQLRNSSRLCGTQ